MSSDPLSPNIYQLIMKSINIFIAYIQNYTSLDSRTVSLTIKISSCGLHKALLNRFYSLSSASTS